MTAPSNVLPLRAAPPPGASPTAQNAPRAPAREEAPERKRWLRRPEVSPRAVSAIFAGGTIVGAAPPSITAVWAAHASAAAYYRHRPFRYARLAYGVVHAFVEVPVLYGLAWAGSSVPLRLATYATIAVTLWLLGVI